MRQSPLRLILRPADDEPLHLSQASPRAGRRGEGESSWRQSSGSRLSGSEINSLVPQSGRTTTRPSSKTRIITPRREPRSVFTRSPEESAALRQSSSTMATIASRSSTPATKCATAEITSRRRVGGSSAKSKSAMPRATSAKVLPLKKGNGAFRWQRLRNSKVSRREDSRPRSSSHSPRVAS